MKELLEALESATNVQSIKFNTDSQLWEVAYKNNLPNDSITSELLIDFLLNA